MKSKILSKMILFLMLVNYSCSKTTESDINKITEKVLNSRDFCNLTEQCYLYDFAQNCNQMFLCHSTPSILKYLLINTDNFYIPNVQLPCWSEYRWFKSDSIVKNRNDYHSRIRPVFIPKDSDDSLLYRIRLELNSNSYAYARLSYFSYSANLDTCMFYLTKHYGYTTGSMVYFFIKQDNNEWIKLNVPERNISKD